MIKIFQWRFIFILMHFLGSVWIYMMRVNISIAVLSMVNFTMFKIPNNTLSECYNAKENKVEVQYYKNVGTFMWTETDQSTVLSAFYWGYALLQIPTGILTVYVKSKTLYMICTVLTGILTLLTPVAAYWGLGYLITVRFFIGLAESPFFPSLFGIAGRWILDNESSIAVAVITSGGAVGTIFGQIFAGFLADNFGWQWIFYVMGSGSLITSIIHFFIITDSPINHPFISKREKNLLYNGIVQNQKTGTVEQRLPVPYLEIAKSKPFWGLLIVHTTFNFTWYTMINSLPYYIGLVLGYPLTQNGALSSAPYMVYVLIAIITSVLAQYLKSKSIMSMTTLRKLFISGGLLLGAITQFSISYTGCSVAWSITLICLTMGVLGNFYSNGSVNFFDIAPSLAGLILSFPNTVSNTMGFVTPYVKEYFTRTGETRENWSNIFLLSSILLVIGSLSYAVLGSGDVQPWDPSYRGSYQKLLLVTKEEEEEAEESDKEDTEKLSLIKN